MEKKQLLHKVNSKGYPILYAFTWNPNPNKFIWSDDEPIHLFKEHLKKIKIIRDNVDFIVPEFSDHGKLHYHGLIKVVSDATYWQYIDGLKRLKRTGFIKSKCINDQRGLNRWINYCGGTWTRTVSRLFRNMTPFQAMTYDKLIDEARSELEDTPTQHVGSLDFGPDPSELKEKSQIDKKDKYSKDYQHSESES